jgi:hypothetical protein
MKNRDPREADDLRFMHLCIFISTFCCFMNILPACVFSSA